MLTSRLTRTLVQLRPLLAPASSSSLGSRLGRRQLHARVPLPYALSEGLGDFISPAALQTIAVDWQQGVLDRLTDLARGTAYESNSVAQILIHTAQDPSLALTFNYASEALNNSFFLSTLTPDSSKAVQTPNAALTAKINSTFPSFISHFSAHVAGLHPSSGAYVWLVMDSTGGLGVVGTYAGGTLLVRERKQVGVHKIDQVLGQLIERVVPAEEQEVPEEEGGASSAPSPSLPGRPVRSRSKLFTEPILDTSLRSFSTSAARAAPSLMDPMRLIGTFKAGNGTAGNKFNIGAGLRPLLCLSVHPHCYLQDHGVWGRDEYVKRWWNHIDWKAAEQAYQTMIA